LKFCLKKVIRNSFTQQVHHVFVMNYGLVFRVCVCRSINLEEYLENRSSE